MARSSSVDRVAHDKLKILLQEKDIQLEEAKDKLYEMKSKTQRDEKILRKRIDTLNQEIEELQTDNKSDEIEMKEYMASAKCLEKKRAILKTQLQSKTEEMRKKKESHDLEILHREEKRDKDTSQEQKRFENEINQLKVIANSREDDIRKLKEEVMRIEANKRTAVKKLKKKIDEHITTNGSLKQNIDVLDIILKEYTDHEEIERNKEEQLSLLLKNQKHTIEDHNIKITTIDKELFEYKRSFPSSDPNITRKYFATRTIEAMNPCQSTMQAPSINASHSGASSCPNCRLYFAENEIEGHLEMCLQNF